MKKLTILLPDETFNILNNYCSSYISGDIKHKSLFYKDVVNFAILNYCSKNTVFFSSNNNNIEKE